MRSVADDVEAVGRIAAVPTILEAVARATGMRFTAVARVTDQTWTVCAVRDFIDFGLRPGGELQLETTICNEIRQHHQPVVFGHASANPQFSGHPTPKRYGFESYISIPIIRTDGSFFGTLCAIDPLPAKLDDPNIVKTLELFAQLIALNLDTVEQLEQKTVDLSAANDLGRLRDQFIAVLGHDLRNPLSSLSMAVTVLEKKAAAREELELIAVIKRSCARMTGLIENVLDFARGKLGGGMPVSLAATGALAADLEQVVAEVRSTHPRQEVLVAIELSEPITCDSQRIAQLFGNLLLNAIAHGDPDQPVIVTARTDGGAFELAVANRGPTIPEAIIGHLFEPFTRSSGRTSSRPSGDGLGLGLYIVSTIAKAHHGKVEVSSSAEDGTCFVFRMPCRQPVAG